MRTLGFILSKNTWNEVQDLAKRENENFGSLVRKGLSLLRLIITIKALGLKVMCFTKDGKPLYEMVLPK